MTSARTASASLRRAARPAVLLVAVTAGLAVTLAGCSASGSGSGSGSGGTAGGAPSGATGTNRYGGQRPPGVSGTIAAVSGKTLQVQSTSDQTAVSWTSKTVFTQTKATTAKALKTGLCATVRSTNTAGGGNGGTGSTAAPATAVTAASVTLSAPVDGTCTGGFGGFGGARPSGAPSGRPSGAAPSGGRPGGPGGYARGTDGKVTSVSGSTFVVAARQPGGTSTTNVTVTTASSTTWSEVARTTAKAATVGRCAIAMGATSGTGALTATTIRLSAPASGGTCTTFAGGRGRGANGQNGQPGQGASANG